MYVCRVIYNSFEHSSTNQNQGPELSEFTSSNSDFFCGIINLHLIILRVFFRILSLHLNFYCFLRILSLHLNFYCFLRILSLHLNFYCFLRILSLHLNFYCFLRIPSWRLVILFFFLGILYLYLIILRFFSQNSEFTSHNSEFFLWIGSLHLTFWLSLRILSLHLTVLSFCFRHVIIIKVIQLFFSPQFRLFSDLQVQKSELPF